uniref:UPF0235 protein n=1 Tax=Steinernema glaseri TaxID=37863 RepID=A0A1I7Y3A6_9BILA
MAAAMDGHGFPKISVSLTKRQNKRISYESQRILGHVFSFSAGSRGDKRIREGKAKIFECLACLAKKGRLKRTLGAAGNSTPVARVRVSADLKHFVEDPETDKLIREHGCIEENVVVVKKEAPDEEELEEEFRRASGQVA